MPSSCGAGNSRPAEVRLLQRATREGPGLHAPIGIVEELLQRAPEHGVLHAQVHQPVSRQPGEEAVEAEAGDDQVHIARRLPRRDEEVGDVLAADRLLEVPDHPGEQARQIVGVEHHGMVDRAQLARHDRRVHQLAIILAVARRKGVDLPIARDRPRARGDHRRVEAAAQRDTDPLVRLRLHPERLEEALPQARGMTRLVSVRGTDRDVPEAATSSASLLHLHQRARRHGMHALDAGEAGEDPLGVVDRLEGGAVGDGGNGRNRKQRLVLAGEDQPLAIQREVERGIAHPVAGEDHAAISRVPQR